MKARYFSLGILFSLAVGVVFMAQAQVVNPTYLRKLGTNIYGYPNTSSTTLGTSTEPGAFSNVASGNINATNINAAQVVATSTPVNWNNVQSALQFGGGFSLGNPNLNNFNGISAVGQSTAGVIGAINVPASSTLYAGAAGVLGLAQSASTGTYPITGTAAEGGRFQATIAASGSSAWGITTLAEGCNQTCSNASATAYAAGYLIGGEFDVNESATGTSQANSVFLVKQGNATATNDNAALVAIVGTSTPWQGGFTTTAGSAVNGVIVGQTTTGTSTPSQNLQFLSTDSGGTSRPANIYEDATGALVLSPNQTISQIVGVQGRLNSYSVVTTVNTSSAFTYSGSSMVQGLISRLGLTGNTTDTLPAASSILSSIGACTSNATAFNLSIRNINATAQSLFLAAGSGDSFSPANGTAITQNQVRTFLGLVTNCATPTVTFLETGNVNL